MYIVYKRMQYILAIILLSSVTPYVAASNCSSLQFQKSEINGKQYIARIKLNNGLMLESHIRKLNNILSKKARQSNVNWEDERKIINGDKTYYLASGEHELTVEYWDEKDFRRLYTKTIFGSKLPKDSIFVPIKMSTFKLKTFDNLAYKVDFKLNGEVNITTKKIQCTLSGKQLLPAITVEPLTIPDDILPEHLERRLRVVMNKMLKNGPKSGLIMSKISNYFGAVQDNNYQGRKGDIRVLTVLPYSLAYNLGLLSGDVIVGYGDENYTTLAKFLASLKFKNKIEINILRNENLIKLEMEYHPVVIPQVLYGNNEKATQKDLITGVEFDAKLEFEFDQLLVEISDYYRKDNFKGKLNLVRDNTLSPLFGLTGTLEKASPSTYRIIVDHVHPTSAAEILGLKVGDKILSVNEKTMNTRDIKHINDILRNHQQGREYKVLLLRNGIETTLTGYYTASEFSAFSVIIDLDSIDKYKDIVTYVEGIKQKSETLNYLFRGNYRYRERDSGSSGNARMIQYKPSNSGPNNQGKVKSK